MSESREGSSMVPAGQRAELSVAKIDVEQERPKVERFYNPDRTRAFVTVAARQQEGAHFGDRARKYQSYAVVLENVIHSEQFGNDLGSLTMMRAEQKKFYNGDPNEYTISVGGLREPFSDMMVARVIYTPSGERKVTTYSQSGKVAGEEWPEDALVKDIDRLADLPVNIDMERTLKGIFDQLENRDFSKPVLYPAVAELEGEIDSRAKLE